MTKSNRQMVLELFEIGVELTSYDIRETLKIPLSHIGQYLNQYVSEGRLKIVDKLGRYNVYTVIPREERNKPKKQDSGEAIECLKFLNDFFKKNYKVLSNRKSNVDYILENEETFEKIEEMIKSVELT